MPIPNRSHHTESLLKPKKALALAKGTPLSVRIDKGSPKSLKALSNTVNAYISLVVPKDTANCSITMDYEPRATFPATLTRTGMSSR